MGQPPIKVGSDASASSFSRNQVFRHPTGGPGCGMRKYGSVLGLVQTETFTLPKDATPTPESGHRRTQKKWLHRFKGGSTPRKASHRVTMAAACWIPDGVR
jgi:hypothetical protein